MQISKYQKIYDKIKEKIGNITIKLSAKEAYEICKANKIITSFPLEDFAYYKGMQEGAEYSPEKYKELVAKTKGAISASKQDATDTTGDFNIFKLKNYNEKSHVFEIQLAEIAKNYFLCHQRNVDNFRKGLKSLETVTHMQICEHVLNSVRGSFVGELETQSHFNPNKMSDEDIDYYYGDDWTYEEFDKDEIKAQEAEKVVNVLKEIEGKAADYENTKDQKHTGIVASLSYNNFSKQMFVDLVTEKYQDNPIVKKAVSVYVESQSDKSLMSQMETIFNNYIDDKQRRIVNEEKLAKFFSGSKAAKEALEDLLK